ncbi:MAG: hypothetical protein K9M57_08990 [Phycisphaerae bacterium]|nr:hypothetical protein [Phycisphaerae bacterium]
MLKWFRQLDKIIRGDATQMASLRAGQIEFPFGGITIALTILGLGFGLCMGSFKMTQGHEDAWKQLFASMVKFPLLFFLTLLVTFPSLYVFNALMGSRLSTSSTLRLLVAAFGIMLAMVASLGTIVVFFSLSTTSYSFMILLNVAVCAIAGVLGLTFLLRTLQRLILAQEYLYCQEMGQDRKTATVENEVPVSEDINDEHRDSPDDVPVLEQEDETGSIERKLSKIYDGKKNPDPLSQEGGFASDRAKKVFRIWIFVFALVGAQMSWVLRPFIGHPDLPFQWFRPKEGDFFTAVLHTLGDLFTF